MQDDLRDELCQALFIDSAGLESAELLASGYGARPTDDFVGEAWDILRERWLHHDREFRDWVVATLRELRGEEGQITNRRSQMEYLRELSNAKTLRSVVLEASSSSVRITARNERSSSSNRRPIL